MEVRCTSCSATLKTREEHIGRKVRCPKCSATVSISDPNVPEELVDFIDDDDESNRPVVTRKRDAKQRCRMCGAPHPRSANECVSCGKVLSSSPSRGGVWRSGKILVMQKDAKLPNRCVKTNGPADHWLKRDLSWHPPAVFLTILVGLYVIIALAVRKTATIQIGLCDAAQRRRYRAMIAGWLGGLLTLAGLGAGVASFDSSHPELCLMLFVGGIVLGLTGLFWAVHVANCISPTKINKQYIWLSGVHPDFLAELPEWADEK